MIVELNERSREIFRHIVDSYVESGEPVGSRTLSRRLGAGLSPATIRNVMADLEEAGLLYAPHISAGRLPTDAGLRLFVDGLLEVGRLSEDERHNIDAQCTTHGRSLPQMLEEASQALSGLASCAGLVLAPKSETTLKHIEFVPLSPGRALVVLITEEGLVENRIIDVPHGLPPSTLTVAGNFLNARLTGRSVAEARAAIESEMQVQKAELDVLTTQVVQTGLAVWAEDSARDNGMLIVSGQSNLLQNVTALADLERIRMLFKALETKESMIRLLDATHDAQGVRIFIGAHNDLFFLAGCSLIIAPYTNGRERIVGAIGVIGPTRINYARIVPMVDYTAKVIGRLLR